LNNSRYKIAIIASGSSGNCAYIEAAGLRLLIDAGISCRRIENGLKSIGADCEAIDAVFVTHEHIDHVSGLSVFAKKYHKNIYLTNGTFEGLDKKERLVNNSEINIIKQFSEISINGAAINTFLTDHDAREPFGVSINVQGLKISYATDLGYVNKAAFEYLKNSNILVLESNYDEQMLINGSYPWHLKKRIMGKRGHLSNADSAKALRELNWDGLSHIYLAHISRENNTHQTAADNLETVFKNERHRPLTHLSWHDRVSECIFN